jgi:hypothetical protein
MATLSITAASVLASASAVKTTGVAGATITAGQVLYKDGADSNKMKLADANGAAALRVVEGIALHGASAGQPITYVTRDPGLTVGATLVVGTSYMLASDTPGGIAPDADAAAGDYVTVLGVAKSTTQLNFQITASGAVKA